MTASPAPSGKHWIPWSGGECPLSAETWIEYQLRDGIACTGAADTLRWSHNGGAGDVIAYRIIPESPND